MFVCLCFVFVFSLICFVLEFFSSGSRRLCIMRCLCTILRVIIHARLGRPLLTYFTPLLLLSACVIFSVAADAVAVAAAVVAAAAAAVVVVVVVGWVLELQGRKTVPVVLVRSLRPKVAAAAVASACCCSLFLCLRTYQQKVDFQVC